LTSVNGQAYTWDNNGNLTNDGSKTYLYNQANQLTSIAAPGLTLRLRSGQAWSASYNGDGARLRQIVNGVPTTYTLDLVAPLVTALAERTSATTKQYLYGQGDSPMAVYSGTAWTYLSGQDGLNSVRQETDASGNVLTARSFDPYGVPLDGNGGSPFGYTGEQTDVTGLVFLRARYMQPGLGMFLSRDPWGGTANRPATIQGYNYAADNPILFRDPAGTDYVLEIDRYTCNDSHVVGGYVYQYDMASGTWGLRPCRVNVAGYTVIPEGSPFHPDPSWGPGNEPPMPSPNWPPSPEGVQLRYNRESAVAYAVSYACWPNSRYYGVFIRLDFGQILALTWHLNN
jgi:RHS repeat-associated protein